MLLLHHFFLSPPNTYPEPILKAALFIGHNHIPERTSWLPQACSSPAEAEPAFLNLFAKFMYPQMGLLTERSDLQALQHLHCFKRNEETFASNYHIYSFFFSPVENRPGSVLKTCKYFTFVWKADFLLGFWKLKSLTHGCWVILLLRENITCFSHSQTCLLGHAEGREGRA